MLSPSLFDSTSTTIRLSTNVMTLIPNDFHRITKGFNCICNGCGVYPSGHLVPSPFVRNCLCSYRWYLLSRTCPCRLFCDFTPWKPFGTFSILLYSTTLYSSKYHLSISIHKKDKCYGLYNLVNQFQRYIYKSRCKFKSSFNLPPKHSNRSKHQAEVP